MGMLIPNTINPLSNHPLERKAELDGIVFTLPYIPKTSSFAKIYGMHEGKILTGEVFADRESVEWETAEYNL